MRRAPAGAVAAALVVLGACAGGNDIGRLPATTTTRSPAVTSTVAAATSTTSTTANPIADAAGSVTLRVTAFTLPDQRSGGSGMRLAVHASSPRLTVRRRGGGGAVSACPVAGPTAAVAPGECADLPASGVVELSSSGGVELRATGAEAAVDEVAVTYLAATRATTIVTPARPAGACAAKACEATFALLPARAGAFTLDGRAGGGRPRLVLSALTAAGSNRTLATVEGGGTLSIRGSLNAGEEGSLLHHDQGTGPVAPVTAEILWP